MRVGTHPEKLLKTRLSYKQHRVIVPFHLPDTDHPYYRQATSVFRFCIESLLATTSPNLTNITLVNNASSGEAHVFARALAERNAIDRYVMHRENRGKVSAVLAEARGAAEPFVTISDADVLFVDGWESRVAEIFRAMPRAGVVSPSPAPHLTFYCNSSAFMAPEIVTRIRLAGIVPEDDLQRFADSIACPDLFRTSGPPWSARQYSVKKGDVRACVGAGHFVATYRTALLARLPRTRVEHVFVNGLENIHIDAPIDGMGFCRLSTIRAYAYHLGNTLPPEVEDWKRRAVVDTTASFPNDAPLPSSGLKLVPSALRRVALGAVRSRFFALAASRRWQDADAS